MWSKTGRCKPVPAVLIDHYDWSVVRHPNSSVPDTFTRVILPAFVVELISPSDRAKHVEQKVIEYFNAGVQVVWHVHPELRMVRVFTSARHNVTCFEHDAFDAAPALPDLQLTVDALFEK